MTGGKIGDRLMAEAETNLAINVLPGLAETYEVQGRGELQLGLYLLILYLFIYFSNLEMCSHELHPLVSHIFFFLFSISADSNLSFMVNRYAN